METVDEIAAVIALSKKVKTERTQNLYLKLKYTVIFRTKLKKK